MASIDALALLQTELANEDIEIKIKAAHKLPLIVRALGQEKTEEKLLPWIEELIQKETTDDEILFAISEEIEKNPRLI